MLQNFSSSFMELAMYPEQETLEAESERIALRLQLHKNDAALVPQQCYLDPLCVANK
jgi:hypothetical protein